MASSTTDAIAGVRNRPLRCHVSVVTKYVAPGCVRCFGRATWLQGLKPLSYHYSTAGLKPRPSFRLLARSRSDRTLILLHPITPTDENAEACPCLSRLGMSS